MNDFLIGVIIGAAIIIAANLSTALSNRIRHRNPLPDEYKNPEKPPPPPPKPPARGSA